MGCGGSRPTDQTASYAVVGDTGEIVPDKIRPLLLRRLEELKKASHINFLRGSQTQSTKELLKHETTAASDGDEETTDNDVSGTSVRSAKVVPIPPKGKENKNEKEDEETLSERRNDEVKNECERESEESKVKTGDFEEDKKEEEEEEDEEEEEEGRRLSNLEEGMICPGSPSFRVYCIDVSENETDNEEKNGKTTREDGTDNKHNSNEESTTKMDNKKGKRGKRFRRVLPKRSSGKNLFNAKYYTPGCIGSHHSRLAQEKNI